MAQGHNKGERAEGELQGAQSAFLTGRVVKPRCHPNYGQGICSLYTQFDVNVGGAKVNCLSRQRK